MPSCTSRRALALLQRNHGRSECVHVCRFLVGDHGGLTAAGMAIVPLDRCPLALPRAAAHQPKDVGAHMSISTSIIEDNFPERRQSPGSGVLTWPYHSSSEWPAQQHLPE